MTFVEATSLTAAVGSIIAAYAGLKLVNQQRKAEMRREPIVEINGIEAAHRTPGVSKVHFTITNTEAANYVLDSVKANKPTLIDHDDLPTKFLKDGTPVDWPGLDAIERRKTLSFDPNHYGDHYSIPLMSSSNRVTISLIWRWKDENHLRKIKKRVTIAASSTS